MWREQRSHIEVSDAVSGDQLVGALVGDAKDSAGIADGEVFLAEGRRDALARLNGLAFHGRVWAPAIRPSLCDLGVFVPAAVPWHVPFL